MKDRVEAIVGLTKLGASFSEAVKYLDDMEEKLNKKALRAAIASVHAEASAVITDMVVMFESHGKSKKKYKYANFTSVMNVYAPLFIKHGLVLSHKMHTPKYIMGVGSFVGCEAILGTKFSEETVSSGVITQLYNKEVPPGNDRLTQSVLTSERSKTLGATCSYLRRYSAISLLCATMEDEKDAEQAAEEDDKDDTAKVTKAVIALSDERKEKLAKFLNCDVSKIEAHVPKLMRDEVACNRILALSEE